MKRIKLLSISLAVAAGGLAAVSEDVISQMNAWMSANNHNRIIQIQNEGGVRDATDTVEISFYSNSSFKVTSPRGVSMLVDPWRNDPSGAWGLWYRMEFPMTEVDIGLSTHAHFDHDALDRLDANMLLDRMAGTFELGDVKITGIADKHVCVAPGIIPWTDAVKQFEGRDDPCPPTNLRHLDNNLYVIETASVIIQVGSFRLFGRRLFRMAPMHHHLELGGWPETTVLIRLWVVNSLLVALALGMYYADFLSLDLVEIPAGSL